MTCRSPPLLLLDQCGQVRVSNQTSTPAFGKPCNARVPANYINLALMRIVYFQHLAASSRLLPSFESLLSSAKILCWRKPSSQTLLSFEIGWLSVSSWYTSSSKPQTDSLHTLIIHFWSVNSCVTLQWCHQQIHATIFLSWFNIARYPDHLSVGEPD